MFVIFDYGHLGESEEAGSMSKRPEQRYERRLWRIGIEAVAGLNEAEVDICRRYLLLLVVRIENHGGCRQFNVLARGRVEKS